LLADHNEDALDQFRKNASFFVTTDRIPVVWEGSGGFLSGLSRVRVKGSLNEFWLADEALTDIRPNPPRPTSAETESDLPFTVLSKDDFQGGEGHHLFVPLDRSFPTDKNHIIELARRLENAESKKYS
jgi:hypothetical protein